MQESAISGEPWLPWNASPSSPSCALSVHRLHLLGTISLFFVVSCLKFLLARAMAGDICPAEHVDDVNALAERAYPISSGRKW
jgi:hypothetical protein